MNDKLITENIKLVYFLIHKYYPKYIKDEDVIQSGKLGLVQAAKHYDKEKGKFSTYASVIICREIGKELKKRVGDKLNVSYEFLVEKGES